MLFRTVTPHHSEALLAGQFERDAVPHAPSRSAAISVLRERVYRRLQAGSIADHLRGLWLRRHFQQAGVLIVRGGGAFPEVDNRGGRIQAENCAFFPGVRLECWRGATIIIGNGTYLNRNVEIVAADSVQIGRDCKIARDVIIMDTDQHPHSQSGLVSTPVRIGDRVWIGARAIILKGVEVGDDCIIGAGAVVARSVAPGSVVVGPSTRVVRQVTKPQETVVASLEARADEVELPANT